MKEKILKLLSSSFREDVNIGLMLICKAYSREELYSMISNRNTLPDFPCSGSLGGEYYPGEDFALITSAYGSVRIIDKYQCRVRFLQIVDKFKTQNNYDIRED